MNGFCLANACSINLNFLIYIQNLYSNYAGLRDIPDKFPWLPVEKSSLLNGPGLQIRAEELWSLVFNTISVSDDLIRQDLAYWINNKFGFDSLFTSNAIGTKTYEDIKKSFESWYWGTGNRLCIVFSDTLVEKYYRELMKMADTKNRRLKDVYFYLQVIYDSPQTGWITKNGHMIVISPNAQLPAIADIFDCCIIR